MAGKRAEGPKGQSASTSWYRQGEGEWHGFPMLGDDDDLSYCGKVQYQGRKRHGSPPTGDAVCSDCARACGFRRRPAATKRGARRKKRELLSTAERLELALDRLEAATERLEAMAAPTAKKKK